MNDKDVLTLTDQAIRDAQMASTGRTVKIVMAIALFITIIAVVYFCYKVLTSTPSQQDGVAQEDTQISGSQVTEQVFVPDKQAPQTREAFKTALSEFESNIQPLLDNPDMIAWNQNEVDNILNTKQSAIASFAEGAYTAALQQLQQSVENTQSLVAQWDTAFENKYTEALTAFSGGQIDRARLAITQASKIKPNTPKLLSLQSQIKVYPQIAALNKKLDVARVENNLEKQINVLTEIVAVDPLQEAAATALEKAKGQRLELNFQNHINNGLSQLAQGNVNAAQRAYTRARQVFPNRPEVRLLAQKLSRVKSDNTLDATQNQLRELQSNDDWQAIYQLATQAETRFPSDQLINDYKETANTVLKLRTEASDYINRPHRLADGNIQRNAKQFIKKAIPYLSKSPSLATDIEIIGKHIDRYSKRYPVTIVSDKKTYIVVKGVGTVGTTSQKVIQLAVGDYILEGSRKGFRSKQLTFVVTGNQPNRISLVCDERI